MGMVNDCVVFGVGVGTECVVDMGEPSVGSGQCVWVVVVVNGPVVTEDVVIVGCGH